jgi:DNA polymerase I-like protein with 3'-5' exonuclease and polymerase domains
MTHRAFTGASYSETSIQLEHDFQEIIFQQEQNGFAFDVARATALYGTLAQRRDDLKTQLREAFPSRWQEMNVPEYWENQSGDRYPTKKAAGRIKVTRGPNRRKEIKFNPGSRDQVAERLLEKGWKPAKRSKLTGKPAVDESVLEGLDFPEAKLLNEYFMIEKRLGQVAEGNQAWLKLQKNGRIHGRVITNGAVTGRCTHSGPNVTQVPGVQAPFGVDCRSCWTADDGWDLVGGDAAGLELRMLAHYLAGYDDGAYGKILLEGDIHTANQLAFGYDPDRVNRDPAKTDIYALIYGASNEKLGSTPRRDGSLALLSDAAEKELRKIEVPDWALNWMVEQGEITEARLENWKRGYWKRTHIEQKFPAFKQLTDAVDIVVNGPIIGWKGKRPIRDRSKARPMTGLDGRRLMCRSSHSALNMLLQSGGAVAMKLATVKFHRNLKVQGIGPSDYKQVAHIHDEIEVTCKPHLSQTIGLCIVQSIKEAGQELNLRVPLDGAFKVGKNWAEVH